MHFWDWDGLVVGAPDMHKVLIELSGSRPRHRVSLRFGGPQTQWWSLILQKLIEICFSYHWLKYLKLNIVRNCTFANLSIRFSWKKLGLKLFFTTKPNGHFHNLIVLGVKQILYKIACVASEILFLLRPSQFSLLRIWCFKLKSCGFKIRARNTKYTCYQRGNRFDSKTWG